MAQSNSEENNTGGEMPSPTNDFKSHGDQTFVVFVIRHT